jgi:DNA-binding SARP family transcriptional activator
MVRPAALNIQLLGPPRVTDQRQGVHRLEEHYPEQLLCFALMHHDRDLLRESIAALLWPDQSPERSRRNLRQTLWKLKTLIGSWSAEDLMTLVIDASTIQVRLGSLVWVDLLAFERVWTRYRSAPAAEIDSVAISHIERAVELCRGELLEGWYQDWLIAAREQVLQRQLGLLDVLVGYHGLRNQHDRACLYAEQALELDRARELTHQHLIRLHLARGDRIAALRQYDQCEAALDEDLGATPGPDTLELVQNLRDSRRTELLQFGPQASAIGVEAPSLLRKLSRLRDDVNRLNDIKSDILQDISAIERSLEETLGQGNGIMAATRAGQGAQSRSPQAPPAGQRGRLVRLGGRSAG